MADNVTANAGSGGPVFASDYIAGVHYPRSKLVWGPDGTANETDEAVGKRFPVADSAVATLLGTLHADLTTLGGFVDGLEALATALNALLTTQAGYLDGVETLLAAATPAGTNSIGAVTTRDSYSAVVPLTRTADTNAYAANDVIGAATGSTAALTFASMGPSAGRIMITSASLEIDVTAVPSGMTNFLLHLYSVTPPSALGDNVAFDLPSGDRASYLGSINLGAPVDLGSTLYIATDGINKALKLAGTSLFGYLVTAGAYTPSSAAVKSITLHSMAL